MAYEQDHEKIPRGSRGKDTGIKKAVRGIKAGFHGRMGNPAYQAALKGRGKEAVVKISGWATTAASVKRMAMYVARAEGAEREDQEGTERGTGTEGKEVPFAVLDDSGLHVQGKEKVQEAINRWTEDMAPSKRGGKRVRHAVHIVLSAGVERTPENLAEVCEASFAVAKKAFGDRGYSFLLGVHQDGKCPHSHLIVKAKPAGMHKDSRKLRIGKEDIFALRQAFADELTSRGLEHKATLRTDRPDLARRIKSGLEPEKVRSKAPHKLESEGPLSQRLERGLGKLRASEKRLQKGLARKEGPRANALGFREHAEDVFGHMHRIIRAECPEGSKERLEAFAQVRRVKREFEKRRDPDKEMRATAVHWEHKAASYTQMKERFERERDGMGPKDRANRDKYLQSSGASLAHQMKAGKKQILRGNSERGIKVAAVKTLKAAQKQLSIARGLNLGFGRLLG